MKNLLAIIILSIISVPAAAQARNAYSVEHDLHEITSSILKESRQILVHVPLSYKNSKKRYPVVYMLDGHTPHPEMMAGILANQSWGGVMPEMILVSIRNTDRTRDMTPTRIQRFPTSGGADRFLDFISKEVIRLVEANYRTQPYRIFAGHSFAGLTVVYALVNRPDMFNAYIAASPHLQWDDEIVVKQAEKKFRDPGIAATLFLGLGNEPDYLKSWNMFESLLEKTKSKRLVYRMTRFEDESHGSGVLPTYFGGLKLVFDGWQPRGTMQIDDIRSHYKGLSGRFGFKVLPPEDYLNSAGYFLMAENKLDEALSVLQENAANYPDSANVYDSLGECLEKLGRLEEAAFNFEKALNMADAAGNEFLASAARSNLKRVNDKLEKND